MTIEEKINLVWLLLKSLMNLPNNSWLTEKDAYNMFQTIMWNQEKIDEYIIILTSSLEKIGNKIKETNYSIDKMIIKDNEAFEKQQENVDNLFINL